MEVRNEPVLTESCVGCLEPVQGGIEEQEDVVVAEEERTKGIEVVVTGHAHRQGEVCGQSAIDRRAFCRVDDEVQRHILGVQVASRVASASRSSNGAGRTVLLGAIGRKMPSARRSANLVAVASSRPLQRVTDGAGPRHPAGTGPAVTAGARAVGSVILVGDGWVPRERVLLGPPAAVLPLAGMGAQVVALADDAIGLRRLLDAGFGSAVSATQLCRHAG